MQKEVFISKIFWIWVIIFSALLIPVQDIFRLICYIPYIISQERGMGYHINISEIISYSNGYITPARIFDATFLGESSSVILMLLLMILGYYIFKKSKKYKELGLALCLTMIISRLLLYIYIAIFKLWLINDEGIMALIIHKNLYLFYIILTALLLLSLLIISKNIKYPFKYKLSLLFAFIMVFIAIYEPVYLLKDIIFRHDALRETYFWFYQFNKW